MRSLYFILGLVWLNLSGCNGIKPGTYPQQSDIKKGPGLFTGEKGEFELLSSGKSLTKETDGSLNGVKKD